MTARLIIFSILFLCIKEDATSQFQSLDKKFHLVSESYHMAKTLFIQGRNNYDQLKERSLNTTNMFLDLVEMLNDLMAKELRSAVVKFYKVKFLHDFSNYIIHMEEIIDIVDHCLIEPVEKIKFIRNQFYVLIKNFEDVRHFDTVDLCHNELPDEVAVVHCILHQAVLFNETMQNDLVAVVEIKTKKCAQDVNSTLYAVQECLHQFVPNFFDQLLVDAYSENCEYLKVVNASMYDFTTDTWRNSYQALFPQKWGNFVNILKTKLKSANENIQEPLYMTLFSANISSHDIVKALYI
ncbi:unnamed protein product [Pieris macdunnoughi]|uniref:Uncharacterized protein n=2 Tax=Pieris macdunnoughi TaxID=345717 RepID=A0A821SKG1_9NEOP|nr:unnamed protein product [Pieris macdunnoughi]